MLKYCLTSEAINGSWHILREFGSTLVHLVKAYLFKITQGYQYQTQPVLEALVKVLDPNMLGSQVGPRVLGSCGHCEDLNFRVSHFGIAMYSACFMVSFSVAIYIVFDGYILNVRLCLNEH